MKEYRTIVKKTKELKEITCDRCGTTSYEKENVPAGIFTYIETIGIHWGYGSKYDTDYWEWDLCEKCIEETLGKIKCTKYSDETDDIDPEYDGLI